MGELKNSKLSDKKSSGIEKSKQSLENKRQNQYIVSHLLTVVSYFRKNHWLKLTSLSDFKQR